MDVLSDLSGVLDGIIGVLSAVAWSVLNPIASWILGYFPDADQNITSAISNVFATLGGEGLTFNVMYFVDIGIVRVFLVMAIAVMAASLLFMFIKTAVNLITRALEAIPVVE